VSAKSEEQQRRLPPGPYIVTGPNGYVNQVGIGRETGPNGYVDPIGVAYGAGKQVEAIANLFAAAPDMLEALKNMVGFCATGCMEAEMAMDDARKAIAKAEGSV
jgi:hypothetical protein